MAYVERTYSYDERGRLAVVVEARDGAGEAVRSYTYDAAGNRASQRNPPTPDGADRS